jgi:hypothetical protein
MTHSNLRVGTSLSPSAGGRAAITLTLPFAFFMEFDDIREAGKMIATAFQGCHTATDCFFRFLAMDGVQFKALELQCFYVAALAVSIVWSIGTLFPRRNHARTGDLALVEESVR